MDVLDDEEEVQIGDTEEIKEDNSKHMRNNHFYLCLTGLQKHLIDRDLQKLFQKSFKTIDPLHIPIKGIHKKRGTSYAFLLFESYD